MLVSAHDRAVQEVQLPADPPLGIGQGLQRLQHVLPYARPAPAVEPARHRAHPTIVPRQVAPGRTAVEDPENAVEDPAVVIILPPGPRLLRRQQRFLKRTLRVAQFVTSLRWHANNMAIQTASSTKRRLQTRPRSGRGVAAALTNCDIDGGRVTWQKPSRHNVQALVEAFLSRDNPSLALAYESRWNAKISIAIRILNHMLDLGRSRIA